MDSKKMVGAYNSYSPLVYDLLHRKFFLRRKALDQLALDKEDCVLDVGCGTGLMFASLLAAVGARGKLTAVDASSTMIEAARKRVVARGWKNVVVMEGDATSLSFKGQQFDAAVAFLSLSSIEDHMRVVDKVMNATRAGGRFVIVDGTSFSYSLLNVLMPLIRKPGSWDASKDIIGDIRKKYSEQIEFEKTYSLGSNFVLVLKQS